MPLPGGPRATAQQHDVIGSVGPITALLWDLDNVTTKWRHLPELVAVLGEFAGPHAPKIAAGRRSTARRWAPLLNECGFETHSGGRSKSGADRQLLVRARQLHRSGVHRFLLASNDGDLARVAKLGELHVVTLDRRHVSQRLVGCASSIVVLRPIPALAHPESAAWTLGDVTPHA
ncbi:NYN domain-containing protein [Nocardioides cavernae]|uniref:NYN domain-containing protein n=1 Tax=Nocardioides cavernae TaxID=1921566 RepID=UPI003556AA6F